ncbi:MAG: response regulator [Proteobacteria bacterium]|nr:response regulator [Pseudomonadota bacterium]
MPPALLVVEPDIVIRLAVAAYLRECGYAVTEAGTTDEATALLKSGTKIDVAMIDVEATGEFDGFGLAKWMRANAPADAPAKIVLTSGIHRTAKDAACLCEEGPTLRKPYDHQNLERHIRELLAR